MSPWKVFVNEGPSIDRKATFSPRISYISALDDEAINDSMEFGIKVVKLSIVSLSILSSTESPEIFWSFGREVVKQFEYDSACTWSTNLYIHINFKVSSWTHFKNYNRSSNSYWFFCIKYFFWYWITEMTFDL